MKFEEGQLVIINNLASSGLPNRVGEVAEIVNPMNSPNYQYLVRFEDLSISPVKEKELVEVTEEQLQLMTYIKRNNKVIYSPLDEEVLIKKVDMIHGHVEVEFGEGAMAVVGIEALKSLDYKEEELLLDEDQNPELINGHKKEYWLDLFFGHYDNGDETYTVPKDLLHNLLDKLI